MPKLLTFKEIEEAYGLKKNTLTKMYMRGDFISAIKIGNRNYFNVDELETWISNHKEKRSAAMKENLKIREVKTARELLDNDMSKYRPYLLNEGHGLIVMDYYSREDDGSNDVKNIVLTLQYQAPYETSADIKRLGYIEAALETILNTVHTLNTLDKLKGSQYE